MLDQDVLFLSLNFVKVSELLVNVNVQYNKMTILTYSDPYRPQ